MFHSLWSMPTIGNISWILEYNIFPLWNISKQNLQFIDLWIIPIPMVSTNHKESWTNYILIFFLFIINASTINEFINTFYWIHWSTIYCKLLESKMPLVGGKIQCNLRVLLGETSKTCYGKCEIDGSLLSLGNFIYLQMYPFLGLQFQPLSQINV